MEFKKNSAFPQSVKFKREEKIPVFFSYLWGGTPTLNHLISPGLSKEVYKSVYREFPLAFLVFGKKERSNHEIMV